MAHFGRPHVEHLKATGNIPGLIKALTYQGRDAAEVRKASIAALGELRAPAAVEPLLQALDDPQGDIRILAAQALRAMGDGRTVDPFIKALRDPSLAVQEEAALALEGLHDLRAVPALLEALQINVPLGDANRAIAHAIVTLAHDQVEPLMAVLRNTKRLAWEEAARALGALHDPRAVDPLVEVALDHEATWASRRTALTVLESLGWHPTEDRHRLFQALAARHWETVEAFGASAIESLLATLRVEEEPDAQQHAIALLVKLHVGRAVGPLVDLVRGTQDGSARPPSRELSAQPSAVQQAAIQAIESLLSQVAEEVPTDGLRKVLLVPDEVSATSYRTPEERAAAARALFGPESVPMPRMHAKHLARLELYRRGLQT
jgi:HEAT repeat protein